MHIATVTLQLMTPYCQSRYHETPKLNKESAPDYERRTWRERLHINDEGTIVIPGLAFSNCIKQAAKYLSIQVPGKGKATWTKHFEAGISVIDDVPTGIKKENAIEKQMHVPSDGVRGSGKRVMKSYPLLMPPLEVSVEFNISDDAITPEVFASHLQQAGQLIGIGAFRVRNNGVFGRFKVMGIEWEDLSDSAQSLPPITIVRSQSNSQFKQKSSVRQVANV